MRGPGVFVVEAPGTAPGSVTLIPISVYRHSRLPDPTYIGATGPKLEENKDHWCNK